MTLIQVAEGGIERLETEVMILRVLASLLLVVSLVLFFKLCKATR